MSTELRENNQSLLSDQQIEDALIKGDIIISPYNSEQLKTSSYDVTLGSNYFKQQTQPADFVHFPWSRQSVDDLWGKPLKADNASDLLDVEKYKGLKEDDQIIILKPGELILGHTQEFIGGKNGITTMMKARSSMGRNGISVCKCAGWGDVGYTNRWTMEIQNGLEYPIILLVDEPIAQITFFRVGNILGSDYAQTGKYQNTTNQEDLEKNWNPYMMIPQLWKDLET